MNLQEIKQRYGIIGHSPVLEHAIQTAKQVAVTDITVLISGESGVGKEVFPQIIHNLSPRKHGHYFAVNCGAIPEGTIDSELFGHEKGSFTGAHEARKGYFEVANGGTLFLDEVAELPLATQVRLLRVLETGEFIKVGSSKVQKTDVRLVAASNVNLLEAVSAGKFREDLYYRLSTVPIHIPPLRVRQDDIFLLFRKFASDYAEKYRMPVITLSEDAKLQLEEYSWPGNVRQLKNLTEQISILEKNREISGELIRKYLPGENTNRLPILANDSQKNGDFSERELLYKVLFDMKRDLTDLKKLVVDLLNHVNDPEAFAENNAHLINKLYEDVGTLSISAPPSKTSYKNEREIEIHDTTELMEESLSLEEKEKELIKKSLEKHHGKRKYAASELGISERTLYRKLKEYNIS
jgi:transcriptional regulator with PAS, ATPase and Fis domain